VTTINGGTLALSGAGSIVDSSNVSINGTGNLNIAAASGNGDHRHPVGYCRHHGDARANTLILKQRQRRLRGRHQRQRRLTLTAGTETLSGADTYTGVTTINGGTLALSGAGSIVDSSNVSINGTGKSEIAAASGKRDHRHPVGYCRTTVTLGANTLIMSNASGDYEGSSAAAAG